MVIDLLNDMGVKNLVVDKAKNTLHMKIGRNSKGVSHLRIKLKKG